MAAIAALSCCCAVWARDAWIGTWQTSPTGLAAAAKVGGVTLPALITVKGTVRYRLRISEGGRQLRLRLSNEYGDLPMRVAAVSVGLAGEGADALVGSLRRVTFGGQASIMIPAGAPMLSDPIDITLKPLSDLVVSVYTRDGVLGYLAADGPSQTSPIAVLESDATLIEQAPLTKGTEIRPSVSAVDVLTDRRGAVVVAFGDSITEGRVDAATGDRGWPGALSRRLSKRHVAVLNAGIGGNRLLQSIDFFGRAALSRMDQDVFAVPGVDNMIVLVGINDIGMSGAGGMFGDTPQVGAEDLISGYRQILERAHERGIKVLGGTLPPFEGANYYSADKERVREQANEWIRSSGFFDGVIDFDAALRDPRQPRRLRAEYDRGDHLHPSVAAYQKMGEVVNLNLIR